MQKLRAWWFAKQGLDDSLKSGSPSAVLERSGWARSVGGSNPYMTLFSRAGTSRSDAEKAASELEIHELPSARGCTYVVPRSDFEVALKVGQSIGDTAEVKTAKKYLGFTDAELDRLCEGVLDALRSGPMSPAALKGALGDRVRSFGEEGKRRGQTTSLPLALGLLQTHGRIRRKTVNGRLDQERYDYVLWENGPLSTSTLHQEEAYVELARRFFRWIGPATLPNFQWFSGLGVGASRAAAEPLGLVEMEEGSELLMLPEDRDALLSFRELAEPHFALLAGIDSLFLLRRDIASLIDPNDMGQEVFGEKGMRNIGGLQDLPSHAIVDRGRIVGLWEYDPEEGQIAYRLWGGSESEPFREALSRTEKYVRDELGDARSFSLDSPESRKPRIRSLREPALV